VLLLGCTHYPLLKPLLHRVVADEVRLVDSAESTAVAVSKLLKHQRRNTGTARNPQPPVQFFVTDSAEKFQRLGRLFLGHAITKITRIELKE
jgi:glutamate racemase